MTTLFLTGIDTDIGKTIACGAIAKAILNYDYLASSDQKIFTQKWIETGTDSESKDLKTHQKIAQSNFNTGTKEQHSPYRFSYPASPHLSAKLDNSEIDQDFLKAQTRQLEAYSDHLIIEGAGGLCVPLNDDVLMVDLIAQLSLPIILVTSARLGSINHTLLSLEACKQRNIEVRALVYNHYPEQEKSIFNDTRDYLKKYLTLNNKHSLWLELGLNSDQIDMSQAQIAELLR